MIAAVPLLIAWAAGWFWVAALTSGRRAQGLSRWLLEVPLAFPVGAGGSACLYFVLLAAGLNPAPAAIAADLIWLAAGAILWWKYGRQTAATVADEPGFRWTWIAWIALAVSGAFLAGIIFQGATALPHGDRDAWAIWNLRAKFLAAGGVWQDAAAGELIGRSHPEYPLLWSGLVAKTWAWTGSSGSIAAPMAASAAASVCLVLLLLGGLWTIRGAVNGALGALVLLSTATFWQYAMAQYADIPLSLFMLGAMWCAVRAAGGEWDTGLLALSGLLASMAAWTKDEGIVFAAGLAIAVIIAARMRAIAWLLAAVPVALIVGLYKALLAPPFKEWSPVHLADFGRILPILTFFRDELLSLGHFPTHPILLLAVSVALLGLRRPVTQLWAAIPVAALAAGDFAAFWMSTSGLQWRLETAAGRIVLQMMPLLIFTVFLFLRTPVSTATESDPKRKKR